MTMNSTIPLLCTNLDLGVALKLLLITIDLHIFFYLHTTLKNKMTNFSKSQEVKLYLSAG